MVNNNFEILELDYGSNNNTVHLQPTFVSNDISPLFIEIARLCLKPSIASEN